MTHFLAAQTDGSWVHNLASVSSWAWLSILVCLFLSALFSASETALTALTYAKVSQLISKDHERYGRLRLWLEKPNRVLSTILVGNNVVNILASALTTSIAERVFGSQGVAIAVGGLTFIILISGEIVPKTYAKHHSEQVATRLFPLLYAAYWMCFPATWILSKIAHGVVRIFGGSLRESGPFLTEEDLEYMIGLGKKGGVLDEEKGKLLESILEFDDITIREVMVPRINILALAEDATPEDVMELAHESNHSRIPVYREQLDDVIGILYLRDLFRAQTSNSNGSKMFCDWIPLLRSPFFVPSTMKISDLLREFQRRKTHLAIVVDEFGGTMGLVTLEDIIEEIVGEIHDEFDPESVQAIEEIDEKLFDIGARTSLRDLEERLELEFPDDGDYETLGGFVTAHYGKVPPNGESIEWNNHRFTILEADEKHVLRVQLELDILPPGESNNAASQSNLPPVHGAEETVKSV